MSIYLLVYLSSVALSLLITPLVILIAQRIKAVDRPGVRTVHTRPVPRIGGVAIFITSIFIVVAVIFFNNTINFILQQMQFKLISLFLTASLIFLVGLVDDLRGLPARFKFLVEILAAGILCSVGVRITSISITEHYVLHLDLMGYLLTILWIVGITNAVNISDGLDGLAAGISAVACSVIAIFAIYDSNIVMAVLMLALLGSLTSFLFYNFNPARIFLGDCGSLFMGFMIASSSVLCSMKSSALVGLALPVLALGIPIFDTLFSMLRRFLERRSMFAPDRSHFHHKLIDLGLRQRHVVLLIYIITALAAGLGLFMMVTHHISSLIVFFCILLLLLLAFRVVGSVQIREIVSGLQKKYEIANQRKHEKMNFEQVQLYFRNARTYKQWWDAVCETARRMDFAWISLKTEELDGTISTNVWRATDSNYDPSRIVVMTVPINGNGAKRLYEFEIAISVNGSYESAGHRATLFNRLIDEHAIIYS
jgi:UDP-GlcNAc:undecaprenyl-phosphate GlcNAc-1-phosphate transferase